MARFINPRHLLGATRHSLDGLAHAWQNEQAFRHECLVFAMLLPLLIWTKKSASECILVLGAWLAVLIIELLNSAIEEIFDLISTEWNLHIKAGKDMASAAIFLAMLINFGIWIAVF